LFGYVPVGKVGERVDKSIGGLMGVCMDRQTDGRVDMLMGMDE